MHRFPADDAVAQRLAVTVSDVAPGAVTARLSVTDTMLDGHGTAHGSLLLALADITTMPTLRAATPPCAKRLGVSRSEFFSRAAEKALDALDDDGTSEAINRAIAGLPADHAFTDAAAAALAASDRR